MPEDEFIEFTDGARPDYPLFIKRSIIIGYGKHRAEDNKKSIIYTQAVAFEVMDSLKVVAEKIAGDFFPKAKAKKKAK